MGSWPFRRSESGRRPGTRTRTRTQALSTLRTAKPRLPRLPFLLSSSFVLLRFGSLSLLYCWSFLSPSFLLVLSSHMSLLALSQWEVPEECAEVLKELAKIDEELEAEEAAANQEDDLLFDDEKEELSHNR